MRYFVNYRNPELQPLQINTSEWGEARKKRLLRDMIEGGWSETDEVGYRLAVRKWRKARESPTPPAA